MLQHLDFLPGFLLELRPELLEGLELVDELIDDLPEPLVRQVQGHRLLGAQNEVEQVAVVRPVVQDGEGLGPGVGLQQHK